MDRFKNHTAIILAGGKSTRMGEDKGLMLLNGKPMVQYVIDAFELLTKNIIIIANNDLYTKFGLPVYVDLVKDKGPLVGIVTGLTNSKSEQNWIISCDSPFVKYDLLVELMNQLDGKECAMPTYENKKHPLIAAYRTSSLTRLKEQLLLDNLKLMKALEELDVNAFTANNFDPINFKNINSKADL